jgi:uncharacterized protein (DUF3820 family)
MQNMTIGKHTGQPIAKLKSAYLMWLISNDHIRFKHPELLKAILSELRARFDLLENLEAELTMNSPPPELWKTPAYIAAKEDKRAENRAKLEALRAE